MDTLRRIAGLIDTPLNHWRSRRCACKFALDYTVRIPYPTREGIGEILKDSKSPRAKGARPDDFVNDSLVRELDQGGLYRQLYGKGGS